MAQIQMLKKGFIKKIVSRILHKYNNPWWHLAMAFLIFKCCFLIAELTFSHIPFLKIFKIESIAVSDIRFNDNYYRIAHEDNLAEPEVILINAGSLNNQSSFRSELADLIDSLAVYEPKVIGVDFDIRQRNINAEDSAASAKLKYTLGKHSNIIVGYDNTKSSSPLLNPQSKWGLINTTSLNTSISQRYYRCRTDSASFASAICNLYKPGTKHEFLTDSFLIKYIVQGKGYKNYFDKQQVPTTDASLNSDIAFEAVEASELTKTYLDEPKRAKLNSLLKGKIVLIGWLGRDYMENPYDVEDRFRTPTDTLIINRERIMPGVVIHANAIENMISKHELNPAAENLTPGFREPSKWMQGILSSVFLLLFLAILMFWNPNKIVLLVILTTLSIPYLVLVLTLMNHDIYLAAGSTLLQLLIIEEFSSGFKKISKFFEPTS